MQTQDVASLPFIVDLATPRGASRGNAVETQHLASAMQRSVDAAILHGPAWRIAGGRSNRFRLPIRTSFELLRPDQFQQAPENEIEYRVPAG